jgi:transcriptional regulator with XRE-family HTH domain
MVRHLRERLRISQGELARRVGVTRSYITKIESDAKLNVSSEVAGRLVQELGVAEDDEDRLRLLDHLLSLAAEPTPPAPGDCAAA